MKRLLFGLPLAAVLLLGGCGSEPAAPTPAVPVPVVSAPATPVPAVSVPNAPAPAVPVSSAVPVSDELDAAIREASNYLNSNIPRGSKILILNIQSASAALSDYILDELVANAVNDRVFSVIDRHQLSLIREELEFQHSGNVDDTSAQEIGKMAGAQTIVSGAVSQYGETYRLRIRALAVQTAQVQGQFNRNIPRSPTITALINSQSTDYSRGGSQGGAAQIPPPGAGVPKQGPAASRPAAAAPASPPPAAQTPAISPGNPALAVPPPVNPQSAPAVQPAPVQTPQPAAGDQSRPGLYANGAYIPAQPDNAPKPSIPTNSPGLYVNGAYQGQMELSEALDWIELNVKANGAYTIVLGKDEKISNVSLSYRNLQVSVSLKSSGSERKVQYDTAKPAYPLITVGPGVTFTLEKGVALVGLEKDSQSLVRVEGGTFTLNNGAISGNTAGMGGGVYMNNGTFTKSGTTG